MADRVRVRFAPSPTGDFHVGGLRTALFNWLFARHHGGTFVLRIEDTDRERFVPGSEQGVVDGLAWLGLTVDEGPGVGGPYGPYVQSERLDRYHQAARQLVASGHAYECYCSPERLEQVRQAQTRARQPTRYDRRCRTLTVSERAAAQGRATASVVRLKVPDVGTVVVRDAVRGRLAFPLATVDDAVLLKSDGFPTYHLAVVVDDQSMAISHVIRGEEWLSSVPKHLLLYSAFGWDVPTFVHLPLLLGRDRTKLSKRHGATAVRQFIQAGYLPETLLNFLALLGWNPGGDRELLSRDDLIRLFSLERVQTAGAIFDTAKLDWMNLQYVKRLSDDEFGRRLVGALTEHFPDVSAQPADWVAVLARALRGRLKRFDEAPALISFAFRRPTPDPAALVPRGRTVAQARASLQAARAALTSIEKNSWSLEAVRSALDGAGEAAVTRWVVRVAVTGLRASPPVYESVALLSSAEVEVRLTAALDALDKCSSS